jgi:hypothetical protein
LNLIQEIQREILDPSTQLSSILRKAKVMAYRLGNVKFKDWVNDELDGYHEREIDELPDYRKGSTHSLGNFAGPLGATMRNMPIPTLNLPKQFERLATDLALFEGIRALESLLEVKKRHLG